MNICSFNKNCTQLVYYVNLKIHFRLIVYLCTEILAHLEKEIKPR